jgi:hypothetical protein
LFVGFLLAAELTYTTTFCDSTERRKFMVLLQLLLDLLSMFSLLFVRSHKFELLLGFREIFFFS